MSEPPKLENTTSFQERVVYFMGSVDATLRSMDGRLTNIEKNQGQVCPAHNGILHMIDANKVQAIEQKAVNVARTIEQTAQDVKIRNIEEEDRVIVARLSPQEKTQLNITTVTAVLIALWQVVKFIFHLS